MTTYQPISTAPPTKNLALYMHLITTDDASKNPLPWFYLHQEGITVAIMRGIVARGDWQGPLPRFENAPEQTAPAFWQYLTTKYGETAP